METGKYCFTKVYKFKIRFNFIWIFNTTMKDGVLAGVMSAISDVLAIKFADYTMVIDDFPLSNKIYAVL